MNETVSPRRNPNTMNPQDLPGIGPATAKKMIEYRKKTPFKTVAEVLQLTPKKYHNSISRQLKFE